MTLGCVSDLGFGFTTIIGSKTIVFAGNAAAPDFLNSFLMGSITGGPTMGVSDLAVHWNGGVPNHQINLV